MHYLTNKNQAIPLADFALFFGKLSTLMTAGISLLRSLDTIETVQQKKGMLFLIARLKQALLSGQDFSQSLAKFAPTLDPLIWQLVRIGEVTGQLEQSLKTSTLLLEKKCRMQARIKKALFYPCCITSIAFLLTIFMLIFIIPHFATLFGDTGVPLPLLTQYIFRLSWFIQKLGGYFLFIVGAGTIYFFYQNKHKTIHWGMFDRLPFFEPYMRKFFLIHFLRQLAASLAAGIPINDALMLSRGVTHPSKQFITNIASLSYQVSTGKPIHEAMANLTYFPTILREMIKTGEESGSLTQMLSKTADLMEADIENLIEYLTVCLEPLIMLALGVLIGGLVIGMYLPIFNLGSVLS